MRVKLTPAFVAKAPLPDSPKDRAIHWDATMAGFGLMVTTSGHQSFVIQYRAGRRSRRMSLKPGLTLQDARREAKKLLGDVARGNDPLAARRKAARAGEDTFGAIAEEYLKRESKRSTDQTRAVLDRCVLPTLGKRLISDIRRSDIVRLLDKIDDQRGPSMADITLAHMRTVMNWHASRVDDYRSPIVRGMSRTKPSERARSRVLSDEELRAVWTAAEASTGIVGPFVQFLLLSACRRNEAAQMPWNELDGDVWTLPAPRSKNNREQVLPLSPLALSILARLPRITGSKHVFTFDGKHAFANFSKSKASFDKECGVTGWTLHDLRRTARSLMSRAGVSADIAERCLGHTIGGVRGTYDRHAYFDEKKRGFEALASLVERIVNPPADNVVELRSGT
jgi:integrase